MILETILLVIVSSIGLSIFTSMVWIGSNLVVRRIMGKERDITECKKCEKYRDWYFPITLTLLFSSAILLYLYWDAQMGVDACATLLQDANDELNVCHNVIQVTTNDLDEIFKPQNYNEFCRDKGFEVGRLTSVGCNGLGCTASEVKDGVQVTTANCYPIPQFVEFMVEKNVP